MDNSTDGEDYEKKLVDGNKRIFENKIIKTAPRNRLREEIETKDKTG